MNLNLQNKRALVCGSSQGIGQAIAIELSRMGAAITLMARTEEKLKASLDLLDHGHGQQHNFICADFSDASRLEQEVLPLIQKQTPIHILVNNTGGPPGGKAIDADIQAYLDAFNQHLICNQLITQSVVDGMKSTNYGRIINIISTSVKQPIKGLGVSNTIRGAVANWSKTLASELGAHQITVNNVLPGATQTARLDAIFSAQAKNKNLSIEEVKQQAINTIPLQRIGEPEEVAAAVAFLASPAGSYVNGINLPVDGGRTSSL